MGKQSCLLSSRNWLLWNFNLFFIIMTENQLIEHGFKKEMCSDLESNNGYDYYYYILELCEGICLVSTDSDTIKDDHWKVVSFDIPALKIETEENLISFLQVMEKLISCKDV